MAEPLISVKSFYSKDSRVYLILCVALLFMAILPVFPRRYIITDIAAFFTVIFAVLNLVKINLDIVRNKFIKIAAVFFLISQLVNTFLPSALSLPDYQALMLSVSGLWKNLKAFSFACCVLLVLSDSRKIYSFLSLILLVAFVICFWAPLDNYLRGYGSMVFEGVYKLRGTKGTGHRFAKAIYFLSIGVWGLILSPGARKVVYDKMVLYAGYILCIASPVILLRARIPKIENTSWLPVDNIDINMISPARPETFCLLTVLCVLVSMLFWTMYCKFIKVRLILLISTAVIMFANLILTGVRLQAFGFLFLGIGGIVLSSKISKKIIMLVIMIFILLCATFVYFVPSAMDSNSLITRLQIWEGCSDIIEKNYIFGLGNHEDFFINRWQAQPAVKNLDLTAVHPVLFGPHKNAQHCHNMWLQMLIERGIFGVFFFHFLWASLFSYICYHVFFDKNHNTNNSLYGISAICLLANINFLMDGIFNVSFHGLGLSIFAIFSALGIVAVQMSTNSVDNP